MINCDVFYRDRKTFAISIRPGGTVEIKAPLDATKDEIEAKLIKRSLWIRKQQRFFDQFKPRTPPRLYVGGETHLYLGRQYRLRIARGKKNSIKMIRGYFVITTEMRPESAHVKALIDSWYSQKARIYFARMLDLVFPKFGRRGFNRPALIVKRVGKRWGSLSPKGTLTLNLRLMQAPKECIEYVITHELCHLISRNHGKEFYKELYRLVPDWKTRKQKLELKIL